MEIRKVFLSEVKEAEFNYNLHPENQLNELCKSLTEFGQFKNIVIWQEQVIAGNGLVFAARSLGWESLQAVILDDLTEEQAKRLCVADNATPYLAHADTNKLEELLSSLPTFEDIPGVSQLWMESLNIDIDQTTQKGSPKDFSEYDENIDVEYKCPQCSYEWSGNPR